METPITKAIKQFEELKNKAESFRDVIYLDGVLSVLDTIKPYEKEVLEQTHMAGQKDAGVEPSYHSALAYYTNKLKIE